MSDLLALVDRLSRPHTSRVLQPTDEEPGRSTIVTHEPLIKQLREAVFATMSGGNGTSGKASRMPIDGGALEMYQLLETAIAAHFREAGGRVEHLYPEDTLREWYVLFTASNPEAGELYEAVELMQRWIGIIEGKLTPPKATLDITEPCPLCGAKQVIVDPANDEVAAAIRISYKNDDLSDLSAMCHACEKVWKGKAEVLELREKLGGKIAG